MRPITTTTQRHRTMISLNKMIAFVGFCLFCTPAGYAGQKSPRLSGVMYDALQRTMSDQVGEDPQSKLQSIPYRDDAPQAKNSRFSDVGRTAIARLVEKIEAARVDEGWGVANQYLLQLKKMPEFLALKDASLKFDVDSLHSWVYVKLGKVREVQDLLVNLKTVPAMWGGYDQMVPGITAVAIKQAALSDTQAAVRLANLVDAPELDDRVVLGGDRHGMQCVAKGANSVFEAVNAKTTELLNWYLEASKLTPPFAVPVPPKLEKGEFERTEMFIERANIAGAEFGARAERVREFYEAEVDAARKRIEGRRKSLKEVRRVYTQLAMNACFDNLMISDVRYLADDEQFQARITSTFRGERVVDYRIVIPVSNADAPAKKTQIETSKPLLVYEMNELGLTLKNIILNSSVDELFTASITNQAVENAKTDTITVPKLDFSQVLEQASLGSSAFMASDAQVVSMSVAPELVKLRQQRTSLEQQKLAKDQEKKERARIEADIEKLQAALQEKKSGAMDYNDDLSAVIAGLTPAAADNKKFAIIIGIEDYQATESVAFAKRSAESFKEVAVKVLGVPESNIYLLTNHGATGANIKVRMKNFAAKMNEGSTLYFYYAGHGIPAQDAEKAGMPFILPQDLAPQFVSLDNDFSLPSLWSELTKNGKGKVVAFMDSCFSGNTDNKPLFKGVAPGVLRQIDPALPSNNLLVFSAGTSHQFSNYFPEKGHRLFSYFLMKGLIEGKTDAAELSGYLRTEVEKQSIKLGPAYEQTPVTKGDLKVGVL